MKTMPKVGQRVRYSETLSYPGAKPREAVGTVVKTDWLPRREVLNYEDVDDPDWEPRYGKVLPVGEQKVTVKVDTKPDWWPYPDTDRFVPVVKYLEPIE